MLICIYICVYIYTIINIIYFVRKMLKVGTLSNRFAKRIITPCASSKCQQPLSLQSRRCMHCVCLLSFHTLPSSMTACNLATMLQLYFLLQNTWRGTEAQSVRKYFKLINKWEFESSSGTLTPFLGNLLTQIIIFYKYLMYIHIWFV